MSIVSQTEKLQIHAAKGSDHFLVVGTLCFAVLFCAVRNIGVCRINVHMVKQILMHEIVVALVVVSCESFVLIQIGCLHLRKIDISVFIFLNQTFVGPDR